MCHYLLPDRADNNASTKYGNIALKILINKFVKNRTELKDLEAHIAGGAFITYNKNNFFFIGEQNIDIARNILNKHGIRIKSTNTGGEQGKKVLFNTGTGNILIQPIKVSDISDLYNPEL